LGEERQRPGIFAGHQKPSVFIIHSKVENVIADLLHFPFLLEAQIRPSEESIPEIERSSLSAVQR
jgi:hypothetical protein